MVDLAFDREGFLGHVPERRKAAPMAKFPPVTRNPDDQPDPRSGLRRPSFSAEFPHSTGALAEAREAFQAWLDVHAVDPDHAEDLAVVLSELGANAIAATGRDENSRIAVRAWRGTTDVVLEVENSFPDLVDEVVADDGGDPLRGSGRGLFIVEAYSDAVEIIAPTETNGLIVRCHKQV